MQEKSPAKYILGKAYTTSSNELPVAFRRKNISFWSYLFYHYTISACQYSLWQQFQKLYVIPAVQINNKRLTYIHSEKRRKKYLLTRTDLWQTFYAVFQEDKETYEFLFLVDYECIRSFFFSFSELEALCNNDMLDTMQWNMETESKAKQNDLWWLLLYRLRQSHVELVSSNFDYLNFQ